MSYLDFSTLDVFGGQVQVALRGENEQHGE
jgi:hypothetical protein